MQDTSTTYDELFMLVALIGVAGGNFSSSMANIGFFFLLGMSFGGLFGDPLINVKTGAEVYIQS